jgi:phospholipid transport system substrate-binding protein
LIVKIQQPGVGITLVDLLRPIRYTLLAFIGLVLLVPSASAAEERPVELVRAEVAALLAVLDDTTLDAAQRRRILSDRIAKRFDLIDMSRSILAVNWGKATEAQREQFVSLFRQVLEKKYVDAIAKRTTETVQVGGERVRGKLATVIVTIERGQAADIPLLFKLRQQDGGWIAYDANVEGLSLVQHYRERFGAIAKNKGIEGVLEHLRNGAVS